MTTARDRAKQRRQKADEAEQAYEKFLDQLAAPLARQVVNALRAEGYAFTVSTPNRGLRVSLDQVATTTSSWRSTQRPISRTSSDVSVERAARARSTKSARSSPAQGQTM